MPVLAFDTYTYVKKLRDVGIPEAQAAVQVEAIAAIIEERMATKQDLARLKADLEHDIKELETRLLIRLGGLLFIGIGALATLIKLL